MYTVSFLQILLCINALRRQIRFFFVCRSRIVFVLISINTSFSFGMDVVRLKSRGCRKLRRGQKLMKPKYKIISHRASNPASNTDQPRRVYGLSLHSELITCRWLFVGQLNALLGVRGRNICSGHFAVGPAVQYATCVNNLAVKNFRLRFM